MKRVTSWFRYSVVLGMSPVVAWAAPLTPGNLLVSRSGNEADPNNPNYIAHASDGTTATTAYFDEYTPQGVLVQSIPLGDATINDGITKQFTLDGSMRNGGFMSASLDGQYIVLAGYNAALGVNPAAAVGNQYTVARLDLSGTVDTSTKITTGLGATAGTGAQMKSVATKTGSDFWISSTSNSNAVHYTTLGSNTSYRISSSAGQNQNIVNIFKDQVGDAQLYMSRTSNAGEIRTMIRANDPNNPKATTLAASSGAGNSPALAVIAGQSTSAGYDYIFLEGGGNRYLYVAQDHSDVTGGVEKYTWNGSAWVYQYNISNADASNNSVSFLGLSGYMGGNGDIPVLYAINSNGTQLSAVADTGPDAQWFGLAAPEAGGNALFHDVIRIVPEPTSLLLVGLGGLVCLRRRRPLAQ